MEYKIPFRPIQYKEVMPNKEEWNLKLELINDMKYKISKFNLNITRSIQY